MIASLLLAAAAAAPQGRLVVLVVVDQLRYQDLLWLAPQFGPKGFATTSARNDPRPGGVFHYRMRSPAGQEMWGKWVYREIAPPERLVFVQSFSDEAGNTVRAPFSAEWPLEVLSTVTFAEHAQALIDPALRPGANIR